MPEGDTIFRAARTLHTALAGQTVTRFESVFPHLTRVDADAPLTGRLIEDVSSAGKHLLMHFSGNLWLRTHMRMHGSWHLFRPGERWRKPRSHMRIAIETPVWHAVAFMVPVAEFLDDDALLRQSDLREIGPDLLADEFDEAEGLHRMRLCDDEEIADVILNQRVVAGIGNEYKSEVLFVAGVDPFARVAALDTATLELILRKARRLMVANVRMRTAARVTTGSLDRTKRTYVYGRTGQPCRRCGTTIEYARQGKDARGTWWCPRCQPRRLA